MARGLTKRVNSSEILWVLEEDRPKTINEIYFELELQGFVIYDLGQGYLDNICKKLVGLERQGRIVRTKKGKNSLLAYMRKS